MNWMSTSKAKARMNMMPIGSMYKYSPVGCRLTSSFEISIDTRLLLICRVKVTTSQKALTTKYTKLICDDTHYVFVSSCKVILSGFLALKYLVPQFPEIISHFLLFLFIMRQRLQITNGQFSEELLLLLQQQQKRNN